MAIELTQLNCPNCGAPIQYRVGMPVHSCPFCETKIAVEFAREKGRNVQVGSPYTMLPFEVDQRRFEVSLLEWLADGDYTPDDILAAVMVSEHTGVFIPFIYYSGEYRADMTARSGYTRTETYWVSETDAEGNSRQVQKTKEKTDWRDFHGECSGRFGLWGCASHKLPADYRKWCEDSIGSDKAEWRDFNEEDIEGFALEPFERDAKEVFSARVKPSLNGEVKTRCRSRVPGDKVKNLKFDYRIEGLKKKQAYLPLWLAALEYKGARYHFIQSGSSPGHFTGEKPEDTGRKKAVKELMKPAKISALVWTIVAVLGAVLAFVPTVIAFFVGLPMTLYLYQKAKKQQKALLDRSNELRQRLLETVKQRGGVQRDGALGISKGDLASVSAQMKREEFETVRLAEQEAERQRAEKDAEKERKRVEKDAQRQRDNTIEIDQARQCRICEALVEPDWKFCKACGSPQ